MKKLFNTIIALFAIAGCAMAQEITLQPSETELVVNASGVSSMTALQFNLELPDGTSITNDATMGEATASHTLCMETLDNGDHLFILYSMNLNTFKDGELLRLPITVNGDGKARLYNVRFADTEAVSYAGKETATGIKPLSNSPLKGEDIYDLSGRRVSKVQKGIYIRNGRKVIK